MKIPFFSFCLIAAFHWACNGTEAVTALPENPKLVSLEIIVPEDTPENEGIFMASNLNGWNPGDSSYLFSKTDSGTYTLSFTPSSTVGSEFKFTRGNWASVESTASGADITNRQADFSQPGSYTFTVEGWKDQFEQAPAASTAAENVQVLDNAFPMPQLNRSRRIWLYLPKDYATSGKNYPVLYLHDGQNLFDEATGFNGEWGVDESLNALQESGAFEGIIVVGIDNGGDHRIAEYSPWPNNEYGGGEGDAYLQFLVEELKPYIDRNYRTKAEAEFTGLGGSSLGALISLYGAIEYPQTFGKLLLFSPAYWFNEAELYPHVEATFDATAGQKFIMVASEQESESMVPLMQRMAKLLKENGLPESQISVTATPDGAHSEWYWKREFPEAFHWLFID